MMSSVCLARVTRVTSDAVYVDGYAQPIPFDYLVIATGGQYSVKAMRTVDDKLDSLLDEIKKTQDEIEEVCIVDSKTVLLVHWYISSYPVLLLHRLDSIWPFLS